MKKLALGILAHVDAGKTTLSEALLYRGGALKKLGRVDHRDAFLDTDTQERERGITIFSKQALLSHNGVDITLLDTPGHVDFSAEMERTLGVLDCAVLVVSGPDGVQSHTRTLWRLLAAYDIPAFVFVNKTDLPGPGREAMLEQLRARLDSGCVDFDAPRPARDEAAALCDEAALERYLETGSLDEPTLAALVAGRKVFPCYFGSALRLEGVDALLDGLAACGPSPRYPEAFGARVYKIARDPQGARLTYLKVTGGCLRVKDTLSGGEGDGQWSEKVDQIRLYSGSRFQAVAEAEAGTVCAVTGLSATFPGQGLGAEAAAPPPSLAPVLRYQVLLPDGPDPHVALQKLRLLEEEDPMLRVLWNEQLRQLHVQLMGAVQLEVLRRQIEERFGFAADFGPGSTVYQETLAAPAIGIGHYEPLRHYAEVHLLLEPLPRGSGIQVASGVSTDVFPGNWQRLVLTHLTEREHPGALTGAPVTDLRITLLAGKGYIEHTDGGDFRQATYRAVRQGLMGAQCVLLEPWYDFVIELPQGQVGRAMADIQRLHGQCRPPETEGDMAVLKGSGPVATLGDYALELAAYTKGLGRLVTSLKGYFPCHNQAEAVAAAGYEAERDVENPGDSIFCAKGAGYTVKWCDVPGHAHLDSGYRLPEPDEGEDAQNPKPPSPGLPGPEGGEYRGTRAQDKELEAIYARTYGPIRQRDILPTRHRDILPTRHREGDQPPPPRPRADAPEYLLVDGYNIIYAWDGLKKLAEADIDSARQSLMDLLCNYQGLRGCTVILVFDAYRVARPHEEMTTYNNIFVVYTKQAETADAYIEKTSYALSRAHRVRVATSDSAEQLIILGHGASRVSAEAFYQEVAGAGARIAEILKAHNRKTRPPKLGELMPPPEEGQ